MSLPTVSVSSAVVDQLKVLLATALAGTGDNSGDPVILDGFGAEYSTWDTVVIGDQVDGRHVINNMRAGRKPRQENYVQHVWFRVIRTGGGSKAARDAAYGQLAKLEDVCADDPGLGLGIPTLVAQVQSFQCNTVTDPGGWRATLRADVSISVRLD